MNVVPGNSFGTAETELDELPFGLTLLAPQNQAQQKENYIRQLREDKVVSIGNRRNDRQMMKVSAISIVVIQQEGTSSPTLLLCDIVSSGIGDALDLLVNPMRVIAIIRGYEN